MSTGGMPADRRSVTCPACKASLMVNAGASGFAPCPKCNTPINLTASTPATVATPQGTIFGASSSAPAGEFRPTSYGPPPASPASPSGGQSGSGKTLLIVGLVLLFLCCLPGGAIIGGVIYLISTAEDRVSIAAQNRFSPPTPTSQYGEPYQGINSNSSMGEKTLAAWNHMRRIDDAAQQFPDTEEGVRQHWERLARDYPSIRTDGVDPEFVQLLNEWKVLANDYVRQFNAPSFLRSDATVTEIEERTVALFD